MKYLLLQSDFIISFYQSYIYIKNYDLSNNPSDNKGSEFQELYDKDESIQESSIINKIYPTLDTSVIAALTTIAGSVTYYAMTDNPQHTNYDELESFNSTPS